MIETSTSTNTSSRSSTRTNTKFHTVPIEEDDVYSTGLIVSNNCCFLISCLDLSESSPRSNLLHFLGCEDRDDDTDTITKSNDAAREKDEILDTDTSNYGSDHDNSISLNDEKDKTHLSSHPCSITIYHNLLDDELDETNDDSSRINTSGMSDMGLYTIFGTRGGGNDRNYAELHELLVNSLFEDAKPLQEENKIQEEITLTQSIHHKDCNESILTKRQKLSPLPPSYHTPSATESKCSRLNPTAVIRFIKSIFSPKASNQLLKSSSRRCSIQSHTSELLTPSSHRFQKTLKIRQNTFSGIRRSILMSSISRSFHQNLPNGSLHQSDFSARSSRRYLDKNVRLQKDSGKGVEIGKNISANGIDEVLQKINDKMDVLVEVDRGGKWANATLTRIPAKDMRTIEQKDFGMDRKGFVETRSMLAVKLGFVSLKYGVLVYWNVHTGLAELILLRKSCPESFMKSPPEGMKKGILCLKSRRNLL